MYEGQTQETILNRMLSTVPESLDKREGSIIHDACAPVAIEVMLLYAMCDYFLKNTFGDTADREYLMERAKERGITPYSATYAVVKGIFEPTSIEIEPGSRFSADSYNYTVIEKTSPGTYLLRCESVGRSGNLSAGALLPIDYIPGLVRAEIIELTVPGEDEEETEAFRARYLASFNSMAYGGNIADYKEKVNAINGVGGVKVYPAWQGGGTVRIAFMTSENGVPATTFVDEVQTMIDPILNSGEGLGIAPIGHRVTVQGVTRTTVNVALNLTLANGYLFDDLKDRICEIIDDYFKEINAKWEKTQKVSTGMYYNSGITVYISQIESRILDLDAVLDIFGTRLNGTESNLVLDTDALAVRGEVTNG